ncbi:hypothetical protein [Methylobacterium sp. WL8]|uniref:hypothetical protein n=1 Tax=Methylobacterium sp. WL8 TaxID=2603899 RepID=UPI0011C825E8|nr:hypothetical protein [Methylobacterium sp. WL8]TXN80277.1 hypothetical protein FV234_17435 [Methylobacterium sp. WL8]
MLPSAYEAQAIQEAIESGMARSELLATLGGMRLPEIVPPHAGEGMADYVARATGELLVRYLALDEGDTGAPA